MELVSSYGEIKDALERRGDDAGSGAVEPLLRELWMRASDRTPVDEVRFESVEPVALGFLERLLPASSAVAEVLRAGRALVEVAERDGRVDAAAIARLHQLVDRAAVEVGRHIELGRGGRRSAWLSFYAHELKNPLNTMLNALWLLRERGADGAQAARFIDLAERAVKKLEERIRDLKGLDQQLGGLPAGWDGGLFPKRR